MKDVIHLNPWRKELYQGVKEKLSWRNDKLNFKNPLGQKFTGFKLVREKT